MFIGHLLLAVTLVWIHHSVGDMVNIILAAFPFLVPRFIFPSAYLEVWRPWNSALLRIEPATRSCLLKGGQIC